MAYVWLGMLLLLASTLSIEAGRKNKKLRTCEKLAIPECANLGYQRTKFPNPLTNITSQEETRNLTRYLSILDQLNCTRKNAMPFLCSVYVPMCSEKRPVSVPCREFCEKSVGYCPVLAASYGVQWPTALLCSRYPSEKDDRKCLNQERYRTKGGKGKKDNKKQKPNEAKCCRLGTFAGKKGKSCNVTEALQETKQGKRMKVLKMCTSFKSKFSACCQKAANRKNKKQERKNKKKVNKEQRKKQKAEKKQRKQEKQQKRKQKQEERKQKKQERKQKKENRKQKLNRKSG